MLRLGRCMGADVQEWYLNWACATVEKIEGNEKLSSSANLRALSRLICVLRRKWRSIRKPSSRGAL